MSSTKVKNKFKLGLSDVIHFSIYFGFNTCIPATWISNHQTFVVGYIRVGSDPSNIFVPKDRLYSVTVKIFHGFIEFFFGRCNIF